MLNPVNYPEYNKYINISNIIPEQNPIYKEDKQLQINRCQFNDNLNSQQQEYKQCSHHIA